MTPPQLPGDRLRLTEEKHSNRNGLLLRMVGAWGREGGQLTLCRVNTLNAYTAEDKSCTGDLPLLSPLPLT